MRTPAVLLALLLGSIVATISAADWKPADGPLLTRCQIGRNKAVGLTVQGKTALHVSRGLGETLPVRFNCPHHATIIELRGRPV